MPLCHPSWTCAVWHKDTSPCPFGSAPRFHRHFCCLSTLLYAPWLIVHFAHHATYTYLAVGVTSWLLSHHQELHTQGNYHGLNYYGLSNYICNKCSHDTIMWSEIFFDGLHCSCHISFVDPRQHIWVVVLVFELLLSCYQMHCHFSYSHNLQIKGASPSMIEYEDS